MRWLLPLMALLAFAVTIATLSRSQQHLSPLQNPQTQNAPQIKAEQKADSPIQDQQDSYGFKSDLTPARAVTPGRASTDDAGAHANYSGEEGTEFWPSLLGIRLKITDSLLVLFTLALAMFTYKLGISTDKLWDSADNQLNEFRRSLEHSEAVAAQQTLDMRASIAEASRAADAITEQRDLMRVQQEIMASQRDISAATQRAWVRVDVKIAGPIRIREEDITVYLGIELTNFGALPA
jgi:hypothetical protein